MSAADDNPVVIRPAADLIREIGPHRHNAENWNKTIVPTVRDGALAASPNDGAVISESQYLNTGQIGGPLNAIVVVDQGDRVRELERQLREEKAASLKAEGEATRLRMLLKRADEMIDDLRLSGDPVNAPRMGCRRSECAAVRTTVEDLKEERAALRRELMKYRLNPRHRPA